MNWQTCFSFCYYSAAASICFCLSLRVLLLCLFKQLLLYRLVLYITCTAREKSGKMKSQLNQMISNQDEWIFQLEDLSRQQQNKGTGYPMKGQGHLFRIHQDLFRKKNKILFEHKKGKKKQMCRFTVQLPIQSLSLPFQI